MKNILNFLEHSSNGRPITMTTCYDYWSARILSSSNIDCVLVGDSLGMVVYGMKNTVGVTEEMMAMHVGAVSKGLSDKFLISDMPFLSTRKGLKHAMNTVGRLMHNGAQAVKIEGVDGHEDIIKHIVQSGIPVMGHIGLMPQYINTIGGWRVQGRDNEQSEKFICDAMKLQELGCFAIVLECVSSQCADKVCNSVDVPIIGIGAGSSPLGQVLVLHDILGVNSGHAMKFVKQYNNLEHSISEAVNTFCDDVLERRFPTAEHSF
ncbi:MAG: 3-methyl-2-oxobutanoate hydroxymethyltransferase [Candidatus Endonucleobacter sp. (ex Gigantidas childressi)]|nr:3-methyl-2-oxobutanoate hydroxymethyltransferase [Candidatus Endonucleobacter sp. (ex Gigantidas childressi)]